MSMDYKILNVKNNSSFHKPQKTLKNVNITKLQNF